MADTLRLSCTQCGSHEFEYEGGIQDQLEDDDTVTCAKCGASGKYGPLIKSAKEKAIQDIEASFRKLFK